jgi:hypothetical protein
MSATTTRTNRYAGPCVRCSQNVPAETGFLVKANGKWAAEHNGPCPEPTPEQAYQAANAPVETGFYFLDGDIFKVVRSGMGRLYAKILVVTEPRTPYSAGKMGFLYAPDAIRKLTVDELLTAEQAAEFGHRMGFCGCCGRELENAISVELGIGPVCIRKYYPHQAKGLIASAKEALARKGIAA